MRRAPTTLVTVLIALTAAAPAAWGSAEEEVDFGPEVGVKLPGSATPGPDLLTGTPGDDDLSGLDGDDVVLGLDGADVLAGNSGADAVAGGPGADELNGGSGPDTLDGGPGQDVITAGSGADRIDVVDDQIDVVRCGSDADTVRADAIDLVDREDCEAIETVGTFRTNGPVGSLPGGEGEGLLPAGAPNAPKFEAVAGVPAAGSQDDYAPAAGTGPAGCRPRSTATLTLPALRGRRVKAVRASVGRRTVRAVRLSRTRVRVTLPPRSAAGTLTVRLTLDVTGSRRDVVRRKTVAVCA
jgi:hypothetical protein